MCLCSNDRKSVDLVRLRGSERINHNQNTLYEKNLVSILKKGKKEKKSGKK